MRSFRAVLWKSLRGKGVPERLISVIKDMYKGSKAAVRTPHGMTKKMDITVGVHQVSALNPFLFVLTLNCIVNHLEEGPLRTILYAARSPRRQRPATEREEDEVHQLRAVHRTDPRLPWGDDRKGGRIPLPRKRPIRGRKRRSGGQGTD
ncbi:unnamed protein product [Heligmosomoides polygyrus]|uniref:Reverse transcriptase domain-containing protein n=1 Tax=Heligmosomoides polygyrus TaxID=6339 RepID=A0A183G6V7_HELPZ|nr:unnamed protein product [Heligmosomoides polygyrus]